MDEASAAKLEELHLGAVSEGEEWLHRALNKIPKEELRVLATVGGVQTHSNRSWLPVAELCRSLMKVLATSTEVGCNKKKNAIMVPMFFWRTALNIQMLICTLDVCKIAGIGKPISSRCVVFLGVSVCKMMQDNAR